MFLGASHLCCKDPSPTDWLITWWHPAFPPSPVLRLQVTERRGGVWSEDHVWRSFTLMFYQLSEEPLHLRLCVIGVARWGHLVEQRSDRWRISAAEVFDLLSSFPIWYWHKAPHFVPVVKSWKRLWFFLPCACANRPSKPHLEKPAEQGVLWLLLRRN